VIDRSDVVDAPLRNCMNYRGAPRGWAAFCSLGALHIGRLGVVAIDRTRASATLRYEKIVKMLDAESGRRQ